MNKWFRDVMLIPAIITVVIGVVMIYVGAWILGQPVVHPLDFTWVFNGLHLPVPLWLILPFVALSAVITALYLHERGVRISADRERQKIEDEISGIRDTSTKLHGIWNNDQTFWAMGKMGDQPMMQIVGWINLTSSNTTHHLRLMAAYIDGQRARAFFPVDVKPNYVNNVMLGLYFVPPLEKDLTKPFTATIVLEDQFNRKFSLPIHTFGPTPGQTMPGPQSGPTAPQLAPSTHGPELTLVWRISGWCWTKEEGEMAVRFSGDCFLQIDNVPEKVLIVDVRIEGAERVGIFNAFELEPGQRTVRGISANFKGLKPNGKEPLTVTMTFIDFKGNLCPVKEATFKPLADPERHNGISWRVAPPSTP